MSKLKNNMNKQKTDKHHQFNIQELGFKSCAELATFIYHEGGIEQSLESLLKIINKSKNPPPSIVKSIFFSKIDTMEDIHKLYSKSFFVLTKSLQGFINEEKEVVINHEKIDKYEKIFDRVNYYYKNNDHNSAKLLLMQENLWKEPHWLNCKKALREKGVPLYAINGFQTKLIANAHDILQKLIQEKKEENPYLETWKKIRPELIQSAGMGGILFGVGHYLGAGSLGVFIAGALSSPMIEALKGKGLENFKKIIGGALSHKIWQSRVRTLNRMLDVIADYHLSKSQADPATSLKLRTVLERLSTHNDKLSVKNSYLMNEEEFVPHLTKELEKAQQHTLKSLSKKLQNKPALVTV